MGNGNASGDGSTGGAGGGFAGGVGNGFAEGAGLAEGADIAEGAAIVAGLMVGGACLADAAWRFFFSLLRRWALRVSRCSAGCSGCSSMQLGGGVIFIFIGARRAHFFERPPSPISDAGAARLPYRRALMSALASASALVGSKCPAPAPSQAAVKTMRSCGGSAQALESSSRVSGPPSGAGAGALAGAGACGGGGASDCASARCNFSRCASRCIAA